jgi:hypothetical protein
MASPVSYRLRLLWIALIVCLLSIASFLTLDAQDEKISAYDTPFSASMVYLNTNNSASTLSLDYYPAISAGGTATPIPVEALHAFELPPLGSRSFTIERLLQRTRNFQGAGVALSDESFRTTVVLVPQYTANPQNSIIQVRAYL